MHSALGGCPDPQGGPPNTAQPLTGNASQGAAGFYGARTVCTSVQPAPGSLGSRWTQVSRTPLLPDIPMHEPHMRSAGVGAHPGPAGCTFSIYSWGRLRGGAPLGVPSRLVALDSWLSVSWRHLQLPGGARDGDSLALARALCVQGRQSPGRRLLAFPRQTAGCLRESQSSRGQLTPACRPGGRAAFLSRARDPEHSLSGCFYQDLSLPDLILWCREPAGTSSSSSLQTFSPPEVPSSVSAASTGWPARGLSHSRPSSLPGRPRKLTNSKSYGPNASTALLKCTLLRPSAWPRMSVLGEGPWWPSPALPPSHPAGDQGNPKM